MYVIREHKYIIMNRAGFLKYVDPDGRKANFCIIFVIIGKERIIISKRKKT
jgi:hypothetical protein